MNNHQAHAMDALFSFQPVFSLKPSDRMVIYGAGNFGKAVARCLIQENISVLAFLDRKATPASRWEGIPIYTPQWQGSMSQDNTMVSVILAIHNRDVQIPPIVSLLKGLGYHRIVHPIELYDQFASTLGDRYWLTARSRYRDWESDIREGVDLWEDAASRDLYQAILKFRIQADPAILPPPDFERQYFPADLPAWSVPLRLIDCGAYDGETLQKAQQLGVPIESALLFEPDPTNFERLSACISQFPDIPCFCWPCGVFSSNRLLSFAGDGSEASKVSEDGNQWIQGVALDSVAHAYRPTLIKMDVEGAEIEALTGARQLIHANRPGLAISVYHHPCHLCQIPHMLRDWNLGYKFYLRGHAYNSFDSVLYALPGEE